MISEQEWRELKVKEMYGMYVDLAKRIEKLESKIQ